MKKLMAILMALMLAFACLSAGIAEEAAPFIGPWRSDKLVMDGETYDAAMFFLNMKFEIREGGTGTCKWSELDDEEAITWLVRDGALVLEAAGEESILTVNDEGNLVLEEDGSLLIFVPDDGTAPETAEMSEEEALLALMNLMAAMESEEETEEFTGELPEGMLGTWEEVDGYGTLNMYPDGSAVMNFWDDTVVEYHWQAEGDNGTFLDGDWENFYIVLNGETLEVGGGWMIFTRDGKPAFVPCDEVPALDQEAGAPYVGLWRCDTLTMDGETVKAEDFFVTMTIELNADGSALFTEDAYTEPTLLAWYIEEDCIYMGNNDELVALEVDAEGQLVMYVDGIFSTFVLESVPEAEPTEAPAEAPAEEAFAGFATLEERLGKKFVCTALTASGVTLTDVSMLGGEYSVTFYENGTCDFITAGVQLPGATWAYEEIKLGLSVKEAFVIDYYGIKYNAVLTETGFDLDNFGTVLTMELEK